MASPLLKNALKLSSSNVILYLLPLVVTPILSRLYTPVDFAAWGIFSSVFTLISPIMAGCYDYAIVREQNEKEIPYIGICCLIVSILTISLLCFVFYGGKILNIEFFIQFPGFQYLVLYLFLHIIILIIQNVLNRTGQYTLYSIGNVITGLSQAILRILFGCLIIIPLGLIAGTVYANIIALIFFLTFVFSSSTKELFRIERFKLLKLKETFIKLKRFPLYDAPGLLLGFSAFSLPIIILSLYYSRADIGYYSLIIQLLLLPMSFIGSALGKVYYQQISQCANSEIKYISLKMVKICVPLACSPLLFLCLGGSYLIPLFLGSEWDMSAKFAIYLSIWALPNICCEPILPIYRKKRLTK